MVAPTAAEEGSRAPRPNLLTERWRPTVLRDLVGQQEAVQRLRRFGESWATSGIHPPKVRAALLEGAPGTGKTSAARALAEEFGWGLIEMGASDARNRDALQQVAGRASLTNTFTEDGRYLSAAKGGRNLILLDDADCMPSRGSSREEKGAGAKAPPSFRDFLRSRYREISALNQAWGLAAGSEPAPYASFADVPATVPRGNLGKRPAVRADIADWQPTKEGSDLSDRGGIAAVAELVRETRQPMVLTAVDPRVLSRASMVFRTGVVHVRFYPIRDEVIRSQLHRVSTQEHLGVPEASINTIVRHTKGDLRASLNDLELAATLHDLQQRHAISAAIDADQVLGWRDVEQNMFGAVDAILSSGRFHRTGEVLDSLNTSPDELLPWIEENIPNQASSAAELSAAFDMLARAQLHLFRANRWRIWTLWSYATELMTGGVSIALHPRGAPSPSGRPPVEFPRFLMGMGGSRGQRQTRDALAQKIGRHAHLSRKKTRESMLPFLEQLFREAPSGASARTMEEHHRDLVLAARALQLEGKELGYLLQVEEDHTSVRNLLHEEHATPTKEPEAPGEVPSEGSSPAPEGEKKAGAGKKRGQRTLF